MAETPPEAATTAETPGETDNVDELIGRTLDDKYRLDAHLGGGGMGEVYRAEHTMMHKTVAVKLLRPEVAADESIIERFRREAAAAGNLEHPNICAATDFARTDDGYFYLVMEFVDGRSLQEVIDERGALPAPEAAAIADSIAAALERAAEFDVVHRDLKPDNVMLTDTEGEDPGVKVLDFGVAHVEFNDEMPSLTKTGAVFGTPNYMSPEQATGDEVGHRSDLYGLGVVLFEMLTGRELFEERESAQLMAAHITEEPERPSEAHPDADLPPGLDDLVMELLAKHPEGRPESATEVRRRLEPYLEESSEAAPMRRPTAEAEPPDTDGDSGTSDDSSGGPLRSFRRLIEERTSSAGYLNVVLVAVAGFLGLTCAGLSVVSLVLVLQDAPEDVRQSLEASRSNYRQQPQVSRALEPIDNGRPADAVERLEKLRDKRGQSASAHLHFLVGRAYGRVGNQTRALEAYLEAADTNPDYLHAEDLRQAFANALGSYNSDHVDLARKLVETHHSHPAVRQHVGDLAWRPEDDDTRERAHDLLETHDMLEDLARWRRLSIKLRRADSCDEYETYIAKLVDTGDERAAQMIEIYHDKPPAGCGLLKAEDCYACVRDDLEQALETLRGTD